MLKLHLKRQLVFFFFFSNILTTDLYVSFVGKFFVLCFNLIFEFIVSMLKSIKLYLDNLLVHLYEAIFLTKCNALPVANL